MLRRRYIKKYSCKVHEKYKEGMLLNLFFQDSQLPKFSTSFKWFCFKNFPAQSHMNLNLPQHLSSKAFTWEMFFDAIVCRRALKALVMASRNSVSVGSSVKELNPEPKVKQEDEGYKKQRNTNSLIP